MSEIIYKTIIADDEYPARHRLITILESFPEIQIIGDSDNGDSTVKLINELEPDLLFLDIEMPLLNGFEVLKKVKHFPLVIFCTAYDEFALKAFETNAIDYIVKPVKEERVKLSLEKLATLKEPLIKKDQVLKFLEDYLAQPNKKKVTSIPVKLGERMLLIKIADISYFCAEEKYVTIFTAGGEKYLTDYTLKYLEEKLDEDFIRVHRSLLINSGHILEFKKYFGGKFVIRMNNKMQSRLITGRNYQDNVRQLFSI